MCVYAPCTINTCTCNQTTKHNQYEVCNHVCLHMYVLQCVLNWLTHKFAKMVWPKQAHDLHALSMQKCSTALPLTNNLLNLLKLICTGRLVDCCLISIDEKEILMHELLNIWKLVWLCWCLVIMNILKLICIGRHLGYCKLRALLQHNPLMEHWWELLTWVLMQIELGDPLQKKRLISPAS